MAKWSRETDAGESTLARAYLQCFHAGVFVHKEMNIFGDLLTILTPKASAIVFLRNAIFLKQEFQWI
jgi:hypothetical protein